MKKTKSILSVVLLSTFLVGNVFAASSFGGGFFGLFDSAVSAVVSYFGGDGNCEGKQCQTCKPGDDDSDHCRPPKN